MSPGCTILSLPYCLRWLAILLPLQDFHRGDSIPTSTFSPTADTYSYKVVLQLYVVINIYLERFPTGQLISPSGRGFKAGLSMVSYQLFDPSSF